MKLRSILLSLLLCIQSSFLLGKDGHLDENAFTPKTMHTIPKGNLATFMLMTKGAVDLATAVSPYPIRQGIMGAFQFGVTLKTFDIEDLDQFDKFLLKVNLMSSVVWTYTDLEWASHLSLCSFSIFYGKRIIEHVLSQAVTQFYQSKLYGKTYSKKFTSDDNFFSGLQK